ncbi:hypothetical protein F5Y08DRAFT_353372 [Xylaria arbuscula]|nr:hypothetical protein F5Y08DRAFT_353372 [Xylaria arbuscula]
MNQPIPYGYRPVHDLPTPPRSSPPLTSLDISQKHIQQQHLSPPTKVMSGPHRGLPIPAGMTLSQPPPPPHGPPQPHGPPHPPAPSSVVQPQAPTAPSPHGQTFGPLPPPPQWQGAEDSMRNWLLAKNEEERRRQEEEKTRQETLRLEQRKIEQDILFTAIERGIPPPAIPIIFAGMSGGPLSQAAAEWVQQYMPALQQQFHPVQILAPQGGPISPGHRRDSQQYGYAGSTGVPPTPGSAVGPQAGFVYQAPGSPARGRAHTISSLAGAGGGRPMGALGSSALPRLSTGEAIGGPSHAPHAAPQQQQQQQPGAAPQQEPPAQSLSFHHWQPPVSSAGPGQQTSSADSPRKRKATGSQHAAPPPSQRRSRSPTTFGQQGNTSVISNPPPGRRRGHSRQRSDISSYLSSSRVRVEYDRRSGFNPGIGTPAEPFQQPRSSHSVSSMLSEQPPSRYPSDVPAPGPQPESEQRPRATSEERGRSTQAPPPAPPPPPSSAPRERTND